MLKSLEDTNILPGKLVAREIVDAFGLVDIDWAGPVFTWTNGRQAEVCTYVKLDRVMSNVDWLELFSHALASNLAIQQSDHAPILIEAIHNRRWNPRPFRFEAMWLNHSSCKGIIRECWRVAVTGSTMFKVTRWGQIMKEVLRKWNKERFSNIYLQIQSIKRLLVQVQLKLPQSSAIYQDKMLQKQLDWLFECENILWAQKSRIRWLDLNDGNTRYFHASTKIHQRRNSIHAIMEHEGKWIMEEDEVRKCFVAHFKDMFHYKPDRTDASRLFASLGCVNKGLFAQHI